MPTSPQTAAWVEPSQAIVRSARDADAARIAVLATQVWLHTYATDGISAAIADYTRTELTPDKYLAIQNDSLAHIWVAERGAYLIGFYMHQGYTKQGVTAFKIGSQRHENFVMIGRTPPCK